VAECVIQCEQPIAFDLSADIADTGRFVIIDNYEISGGGIIQEPLRDDQSLVREKVLLRNIKWEKSSILREQRAECYSQKSALVLVTGPSESSRKEIAKELEADLFAQGRITYYLGIGSLICGVDADLKAAAQDTRHEHRAEHLRRFAEAAHLFLDSGAILVSTAVDLNAEDPEIVRAILQNYPVLVVWSGDMAGTDIHVDLRVQAETQGEAASRLKPMLQDQGVIFKY